MEEKMVKILKRQESSEDCFVCGMNNPIGFNSHFYETEDGELICLAESKFEYQSYPGRLHGGIAATLLDETMGRAILIKNPGVWGVTVDMELTYKKPVPLDCTLRVIGRIDVDRHLFTASGEVLLEDGTVAVTAKAKYMKMPVSKISEGIESDSEILFMAETEREVDSISREGPLKVIYK
ncbi:MAG: PaaI family thioesterase [Clostridiales bacterium]|nr:PaaI family thioesterase [Clostridiales bacterium]